MMIYSEITPNPSTLKFIVEKTLLERGSADFPSPESAEDSPLATMLYKFKFVNGVFIGQRFVSVTKSEDSTWEQVIPQVKQALKDFLASGEPVLNNMPEAAPAVSASEDSDTVKKIKQLLEENIRPAVAMDGGDVIFESFEEGVVKLRMQGACSGCPSSTATLKLGIQGLLCRMVPGVKEVEAV